MSLGVFLLALGAVARVTRFVNLDVLAQPMRDWVTSRFGPGSAVEYLIECPWCASIWVAAVVLPAAHWLGDTPWFVVPAALLTASYVYAIAAPRLDAGYQPDPEPTASTSGTE